MTALAADFEMVEKDGIDVALPAAVDIMYRGALIKNNAAGFGAPCATEAGATFAGVCTKRADNSAGSAGDINVVVRTKGNFLMTCAGMAQTDVGVKVYATDDNLVTKTFAANLQYVGKIVAFVSATEVWVRLDIASDIGEAAIADLGATTEIPAVATGGTPDCDAAAVDTALDTVETRLDNAEGKIDGMLAVLRKYRVIQG